MSQAVAPKDLRQQAQKDFQAGNFRDAYDSFRKLCLDPANDGPAVTDDFDKAVQCLNRLGRIKEFDALAEATIDAHQKNWRLLAAAAQQYHSPNLVHYGYMISGEYERGPHRGGGKMVNSEERDRTRALQLMQQAAPLTRTDDNKADVGKFYLQLADLLHFSRGRSEAWRLQVLTDLTMLPDYEDGYTSFRATGGAPVDADGNPVFYAVAKTWDDAKSDGERWRWTLEQASEYDAGQLNTVRMRRAEFAQQQFGVQTMQQGMFRPFFGLPSSRDDDDVDESGTYQLHTLTENETIAKLATGIKRFELPDDYNFIKLYQTIAAEPKTGNGENALNALAQLFENRRQYPRAAEYWQQSIESYGPGSQAWKTKRRQQILGNWGRFENVTSQPAGAGASVEMRFRNGKKVAFVAHPIKVDQLLDDVKAYLKSDPARVDWQRMNIDNLGHRLVTENETKYLGEQTASWDLELEPRKNHFDRRITINTPLQKAGAYLLSAKMEGGNTFKTILWVTDTAIVHKTLAGKQLYFIADAVDGRPVAGANLEFFGWRQNRVAGNRYVVETTNFAEKSDDNGQVIPDGRDLKDGFQWLVIARAGESRFAHLGFQGVSNRTLYDAQYNQVKVFSITDRPVYRPDQSVSFKLWVRHAQYDQDDNSQFAGQTFPVEIYNPMNEKVYDQTLQADEYGGLVGVMEVPSDAKLGTYRIVLRGSENGRNFAGGGNFRVEEYKKPEFEVTVDAPDEPIMLGEKITAKINARYYFGAPVEKATVKYKITREDHSQEWFPIMAWDWCYGPGYWWFAPDAPWYPGWDRWAGCRMPAPWWIYRGHNPPEVVAEQEVEIGDDGTVEVTIDTAVAKELHGDTDHKYTITAEVRDESRRTIVGTGKVLVARKPFQVFTWTHRGYYRVGEVIEADFLAQRLDEKPVEGEGVLTLLKITYNEKLEPVETPVSRWDLNTNDEGRAEIQIDASASGQYRLSYEVTDAAEHTVEGGYLFTIIGDDFDGSQFRFNSVELIPDKKDYQPGETVKLQVNTDRAGSTVLLFVRPTNGVYLPPKMLKIDGKSTVVDIDVVKRDMPNFFVEAITISDSQVYRAVREIVVPPEKRVLNVEVLPSQETYKPGEKATVKVHLTDFTGENFKGSTVVTIYDKALEYISGGSNVADIKEFFWKWRRRHNPNEQTSLARWFGNMVPKGMLPMSDIGVFGGTVADELAAMESDRLAMNGRGEGGGFGEGVPTSAAPQRMMLAKGMAQDGAALAADGEMADRKADWGGEQLARADGNAPAPDLVEPTVRTNFADTALWVGELTTDKTGMAEVKLTMPENLTTWKVKAWGMGHGTKVGAGDAEVITRKDLILRLQAPRFFVQKDEVVLSANVHNYLKGDKEVTVSLELPGKVLEPMDELTRTVKVPADGETRVDWRVKVVQEGQAVVRMKALTDEESDAMEMKFPAYVHGMLKTESWAGTVRPAEAAATVSIEVPGERRVDETVLEIRYSPSLATAMVDALPYLADYPYGCTEQTLNRFLPSVITQKVLLEMNLDLAAIKEKRTNLNAQEIGDAAERAAQWKRFDRNPVFDQAELDKIVKANVNKLTDMQNSDGGWGWFSGIHERSWPHTTAVVVHGLQIAKANDVALVPGILENGEGWLKRYQDEQVRLIANSEKKVRPFKPGPDNLDAFVYMVLVDAGVDNGPMREYLYRDRNNLAVYAKAMFGVALEKLGDEEKLAMIMRNIEQYLVQDDENDTAYLRLPADNFWWYWYGSETEANAYYLKLLTRTEPKSEAAPRLVKYLLNNRKHATYWSSTRDTAVCVEAFADYIRATGEAQADMTVEVWLDGQKRQSVDITSENLFSFNNKFVLTGADVKDGAHDVQIRRTGEGPVYFNAYLTNFTLEDPIEKAGLEVRVTRKYYKLVAVDKEVDVAGSRGQALSQKVEKYERQELVDGAMLQSGDLVEVELSVESKNDYEYILFEDMKAAGFEAVDVRSGYTDDGLRAYTEFRDDRVTFFLRRLARGNNSMAYRLRAEIPGKFSALPARASAMYAPELKGNSDEMKLGIKD
ncbi:MAG: MG2 domain-containing protein [Pirellulaceae bacterium]